jgi:hypothetical protein
MTPALQMELSVGCELVSTGRSDLSMRVTSGSAARTRQPSGGHGMSGDVPQAQGAVALMVWTAAIFAGAPAEEGVD